MAKIMWENIYDDIIIFTENELTLDVGCGGGFHSFMMSKRGSKVIGIDFSKRWISIAKKTYRNIPFIISDVDYLPFKINIFDKIFCSSLLHHLGNQKKPIKEFHKILKRNRMLVIIDPNISNPLRKYLNLIQRFLTDVNIFNCHTNEKPYELKFMTDLLDSNNFNTHKLKFFFGSILVSSNILDKIKWCIYKLNWKLFNNFLPLLGGTDFLIVAYSA